MQKDPRIYIRYILEAIANIETDTVGCDFEKFRLDRRARQLVERNLEILSEASRRLPKDLKDQETQIPWRAIAGIAMSFDTITTRRIQLFFGIPARRI